MLDQLRQRQVIRQSGNGAFTLTVPPRHIPFATTGFFDTLDKSDRGLWSASGWAVDPENKQPCLYALALQNGEIVAEAVFRKEARPDVNQHLKLGPEQITGFSLSFRPHPQGGAITLIAVLPSGALALLPGPGRVTPEENETVQAQAPVPEADWNALCSRPLYAFPPESPFHDIYSFEPAFDPTQTAGVTNQFLEEAAVYHRKYTEHARWRLLLSQALFRAEVQENRNLSVLDVGSGSGNTVLPLLKLLPGSKLIATDISPQLLAILRDQINQSDRNRLRLIATDAGQRNFSACTFDLIVGAAILHHIIDPSHTLGACCHSLKENGRAIFFEPFEEGYLLLRLLYEQLLEHRMELQLTDEVVKVLQAIILDVQVRTGSDKSAPIYQQIDDKWSFTRTYFEQQKSKYGYSKLEIYPLDVSTSRFSAQLKTHLRLCLNAGEDALKPPAWEFVEAFERKMSSEFYSELLMEACIILTK